MAPVAGDQVPPWSVEIIHCTVGAGAPLAAAVKLTVEFAGTARPVG